MFFLILSFQKKISHNKIQKLRKRSKGRCFHGIVYLRTNQKENYNLFKCK